MTFYWFQREIKCRRAQPKYILFLLKPVKSQKKLYIIWLNVVCAIHFITVKVPQSNFLSTVIFNFDYVFFLGIYCHFIDIGSSHWVSATKETFSWSQKRSKTPFLWPTIDSLVALTQCDELVLRKWQKMPKKRNMVKIENHCTKKIRLRYLSCKK